MKKKSGKDIADINVLAKSIVDKTTRNTVSKMPSSEIIHSVMSEMGRKGGLKGGKARARKLDSNRRKEIAINAAQMRWKNES